MCDKMQIKRGRVYCGSQFEGAIHHGLWEGGSVLWQQEKASGSHVGGAGSREREGDSAGLTFSILFFIQWMALHHGIVPPVLSAPFLLSQPCL